MKNELNTSKTVTAAAPQTGASQASPIYTGTQVNYYFVCQRKLWLFTHDITMEQESDTVHLGKLLSRTAYEREHKDIAIEDTIVIDFIDVHKGVIHEVKKSRAVEKAHIWQVLYYLYFLKQRGVVATAEIDYPLLRRKERLELTPERETQMVEVLKGIQLVVTQKQAPPRIGKKFCKKCAYLELCWG